MNAKTMEGLAGASTSISMISTPMNIAKEAERKGDTEKMKRAMSYGAEMAGQAEAYSEKTSQGMKLEAEEAKKQEKQQQEDLIRARREERKKSFRRDPQNMPMLTVWKSAETGRFRPRQRGRRHLKSRQPIHRTSSMIRQAEPWSPPGRRVPISM